MYDEENLFDIFGAGDVKNDTRPSRPGKDRADRLRKRLANGGGGGRPQGNDDDSVVMDSRADAMSVDSAPVVGEKNGITAPPGNLPLAKRQRRGADPVAADAFEIDAVREVPASSGLTSQDTEGKSIIIPHQVRHQVSLPTDYPYEPIENHEFADPPARAYGFTLDPFQKTSVAAIERGESVLVSAHTSAGKTVVAEYAIAQSLRDNQRVIYTSPIKALSNQKYREFSAEFGDVGLMTGDTTINPNATCLVMTTEILRSMLYRGSEVMREVQWVVFDEIHYLRDKARGVVWEETIILLPDKVRYVFLSATIPNAMQFAEWICKTHNQPCHVVYTDFRPTPLQTYLFPAGADGMHLVVDEKSVFREDNFQKAMSFLADKQGDDPGDINGRKGRGGGNKKYKTNTGGNKSGLSDIYKIVKMIMIKNYNPVIVFSFSKRECESLALQMSSLAFNDDAEKDMVRKVFGNAISSLSEEDRELTQIQHVLPLLRRGIGIHHSGLLPILKEVIEILFQEGLIKVLFATETFSMGLNMPAKTVVFTNVRKFDGKEQRWVSPSEFVQMSGRAGRRGLDDRGVVILMLDQTLEPATAREIVKGEQDKLNSAFYLGYNMILNLMRVEGISPEYMLEKCFFQFQNTAGASGLEKELSELENEKINTIIEDEPTVKEYHDLRQKLDAYTKDMRDVINHPSYCLQFMQPGRLVKVKYLNHDFGWGAVVNYNKRLRSKSGEDFTPHESYVVDVLLNIASDAISFTRPGQELPTGVRPPSEGDLGKMEVVPVLLSCLAGISGIRIFLPKDMKSQEQRNSARKNLEEVRRRFADGISVLDPIENMGITDDSFKHLLRKIEVLESRLLSNPLHNSPRLKVLYNLYNHKVELQEKIKAVKKKVTLAHSVMQLDELKFRKRVLRRLGFINDMDIIQLKARVACEISSGDELLISELLFNRAFNELSAEQTAALLSCFVFEEKSNSENTLPPELERPFKELQTQARLIAKISVESKLQIIEEEYCQKFKNQLMDVVYTWSKGASFATICKMTDVYEGSLIRMFRRLEELLRQMIMAAKVMGSEDLEKKFEDAMSKIRRDIVNSSSLYL